MPDAEALLNRLFDAYNRRDWTAALACVQAGIDWPDQIAEGRILGQAALEAYWRRNHEVIRLEVTPLAFTTLPDGRIDVLINQIVRSTTGSLWSDLHVHHVYTLQDGRVARLDIGPDAERP